MSHSFIVKTKQDFEDLPLIMSVYSRLTRDTREVTIIPNTSWPGDGLLGITLKYELYDEFEGISCESNIHLTDFVSLQLTLVNNDFNCVISLVLSLGHSFSV